MQLLSRPAVLSETADRESKPENEYERMKRTKMENNFKRFLSLVVAVVMVLGMMPMSVFATEGEAAAVAEVNGVQYATLKEAVDAANAAENGATITLLSDITLSQKLTIKKNITIEGKYTITRADNYTGTLFVVDKGVELTLKNVVVDGGNEWTFHEKEYKAQVNSGERVSNGAVRYTTYEEGAPVATKTVVAVSGSVNLDGATFRNHVGSSVFSVADGAELIMTNALITHNTKNGSSVVASVSAGGTWIINEGTRITDNHNHGGNGSLSYMCGTTIMNGGEISGNSGVDNNGSVFMIYGSTSSFTLNNGRIADNWALYGSNNGWNCAFYVYGNGADFIMNGGIIENNVSTKVPGVANNGSNGTIQINGGEIRNNTSTTGIGGMDLYSYCPVEIGEDVTVTGSARFFGKAVVDGVIMGSLYLSGSSKISGKGTVTQKVVVFSSTNATIESGNYLGELDIRQGGVLTITGGRFADLNAIKYLAPGLGLAKNADGTYTVTDQVAEVNGVVYNSVAAAEEAAGEGNTIKLLAIAPVKESVVVDQQTILDLNNNEIYATTDDVYPVIRAVADVTVTGEGGVDAMRFGSGYAFIVGSDEAEGQLTIESGKHYGDTTVASVTKGTLNIKGGYYEALPYGEYGYRYTLNCIDASYIDGSAKINVTGGTFYGFDPDNNLAEGEGTDFVPESHASTKSENADEAGVYTWTVVFDAVAYNVQDAKFFNDLSDALDAADSGETVQLLKTWEEKLVLVRAGVTFDLNGNVVKTENVLSFGVVMDGKEQVGGIEIAKDTTAAFTKLQPENGGYLPVYDTTAGQYKFFAYEVESNKVEGGDGNATFWMRLVFDNAAAYDVLANTGDSCVDFYATMDWTGIDGFGVRYLMSDENVKSYAAAAYEQLQGGNANSKAMYLKVTGVGKLGEGAFVSATPGVATVAEVAASADALVYNVG